MRGSFHFIAYMVVGIELYTLNHRRMDNVIRRRAVGRNGNVIHYRNTEQCFYVGIVGLRFERVPEKDNDIDFAFCDLCPDLLIAAKRP